MPPRRRPRFGLSLGAWLTLLAALAGGLGLFRYELLRAEGKLDPPPERVVPAPDDDPVPPGHPWAGTYTTYFYQLTLTPKHWRLQAAPFTDLIDMDPPHGPLIVAGDHLFLTGGKWSIDGMRDLVVVPWGPRVYVVPGPRLIEFAGAVDDGSEPRAAMRWNTNGFFLLRDGDEKKAAPGRPALPPGFRKFLLDREIAAKVLRAEKPRKGLEFLRVVVAAGRRQGVVAGMMFHRSGAKNPPRCFAAAVRDDEAVLVYFPGPQGAAPRPGWVMTTGAAPPAAN